VSPSTAFALPAQLGGPQTRRLAIHGLPGEGLLAREPARVSSLPDGARRRWLSAALRRPRVPSWERSSPSPLSSSSGALTSSCAAPARGWRLLQRRLVEVVL